MKEKNLLSFGDEQLEMRMSWWHRQGRQTRFTLRNYEVLKGNFAKSAKKKA